MRFIMVRSMFHLRLAGLTNWKLRTSLKARWALSWYSISRLRLRVSMLCETYRK